MPRYVNLVFQGGGVKGLSYAGAYAQLPADVSVRVVGGASAGAIAAALIACGYDAAKLRSELEGLDLETIVDKDGLATVAELKAVFEEAAILFRNAKGEMPGGLSLLKFWFRHGKAIRKHLQVLRTRFGLLVTDGLRDWLTPRIGANRKMNDTVVEDLRIVASALTDRGLKPFTKEDVTTNIIDAVIASASIPFFFTPSTLSGYMVDGGLLSNFPILLFQREPYPTVGFRLFPLVAPSQQINTFSQFARAMAETMLDGHDRFQRRPDHYREESIFFPADITAIDFNLSTEKKQLLFQLGAAAGARVDWPRYCASSPKLIGIDPSPDKVVTQVLETGGKLAEAYRQPHLWPKTLSDETTYTVRIEIDGTVHYELEQTVEVSGEGAWYGGRTQMLFNAFDAAAKGSIADLDWTMEETGGQPLLRIPAVNETLRKGYVYSFVPPVMEGQGKRTFIQRWKMPKEFARSLLATTSENLSYGIVQRAHQHQMRLKFVLYIDQQLGPMKKTSSTLKLIPQAAIPMDGRVYDAFVGQTPLIDVTAQVTHEVVLSRV